MRIAITGGTGFVGRNLARTLAGEGHQVALIARGCDHTDPTIHQLPGARFFPDATMSFAENLLRQGGGGPAISPIGESLCAYTT